eukprot:10961676-Karenia_brevis.AAC.1
MWSEIFAIKHRKRRARREERYLARLGRLGRRRAAATVARRRRVAKMRLAVTKALSRAEIAASPKCLEAIKAEGKALVDAGTWDESTVQNKQRLLDEARAKGKKIVIGDLLDI